MSKLVTTAAIAALLASPVIAAAEAAPAPVEVAPAAETETGLQFWETTSPILIFLALMGVGVGIAFLIDPDNEPASP